MHKGHMRIISSGLSPGVSAREVSSGVGPCFIENPLTMHVIRVSAKKTVLDKST